MSTSQRGRHRAARHAAPKNKSLPISGGQVGALFGIAGISTIAMSSGSTVAGVVQVGDISVMDYPTVTASATDTKTLEPQVTASRAQAASRSEDRKTLEETELVATASAVDDPTLDPNAVIDITPTVSSTERKSLQALAATTDQLTALITQAQYQKNQQAQILLSEQQAATNARARAKAAAEAALIEADRLRQVGVITEPIQGNYTLSARYGQRGGLWSGGWHTGLDFRVRTGTPVVAAANGKIISAGWAGAYGYRIEIDHGNGYVTAYNHLSKIEVTQGQVSAGKEIGKSGSTGNTTGPHLHFEVTKDGEFMNPSAWLWGK